jgi:hypothetical protein
MAYRDKIYTTYLVGLLNRKQGGCRSAIDRQLPPSGIFGEPEASGGGFDARIPGYITPINKLKIMETKNELTVEEQRIVRIILRLITIIAQRKNINTSMLESILPECLSRETYDVLLNCAECIGIIAGHNPDERVKEPSDRKNN